MKKVPILLLVVIVVFLLSAVQTTRAIHPETPIYEEPNSYSPIVFLVPQNAQVLLLEEEVVKDNVHWVYIQYGSFTGYTDKAFLYTTENAITYSFSHIKATSRKMGETICIYEANSVESKVVDTVKDGAKLIKVDSTIDYGEFYEISYNQNRAFILKQNATTALTYNQKVAVIIGSITLFVALLMLLLIKFIKKHKTNTSK